MDTKVEVIEVSHHWGRAYDLFDYDVSILQIMDDYSSVSLEGDMSIPRRTRLDAPLGAPDFNTLDEPIKETIVSAIQSVCRIL